MTRYGECYTRGIFQELFAMLSYYFVFFFSAVGLGGLFISSHSQQVVWSATCAMLFEGVLYRIAVLVLRLLSDVVLKGRPASGFYFQLGFLV